MNWGTVYLTMPKNKKRYVRFVLDKSSIKWQESDDLKHWTWIKENMYDKLLERIVTMETENKQLKEKITAEIARRNQEIKNERQIKANQK